MDMEKITAEEARELAVGENSALMEERKSAFHKGCLEGVYCSASDGFFTSSRCLAVGLYPESVINEILSHAQRELQEAGFCCEQKYSSDLLAHVLEISWE